MENREILTPEEVESYIEVRASKYPSEKINKLHANIAIPSYVHGYSLAIEYMRDWILDKFEKNYFNTVFIEGRHVLDDYKKLSKQIIKGKNPRIRIEPRIDYDYDRETIDSYLAPPQIYVRKSKFNDSFFKDYDRDMFLGFQLKALRMNFNIKIRVNTRAQQIDLRDKMIMNMRIGSTMHEIISVDCHVPKEIILNIADRAGFEIKNGEVINTIDFLVYLNSHSDLPFLFKIRAINKKAEYFIRINGLYTHINCTDKLQLDDGERDGKLDFNFHIEQQIILTIPVPHFYAFYSASELTTNILVKEPNENTIPIYTINIFDIPNVDPDTGWIRAAITDYATDEGETYMDLAGIFTGDNILSQAIQHDLSKGVSPYHFIKIRVFYAEDIAKECYIKMDWTTMKAYFNSPQEETMLHIAVYYDRDYINELDIALNNLNDSRIKPNK